MRPAVRSLVLALALVAASHAAVAATGYRHSTPGVSGYDLVSYHSGEKPLRGNGNHVAVYDGVTYLFINEKNRERFEKNPDRYVPAYGGYCAYGVALGKKFVGDPDVWRVVRGRLYLNLDTRVQETWNKDVRGYIRKADSNWPEIEGADPATL